MADVEKGEGHWGRWAALKREREGRDGCNVAVLSVRLPLFLSVCRSLGEQERYSEQRQQGGGRRPLGETRGRAREGREKERKRERERERKQRKTGD